MLFHLKFSPVRFAALVVTAVCLNQSATAQNGGPDPFTQLRGGAGEQMMAPSADGIRGVTQGLSSDERGLDYTTYEQARYYGLMQMLFVPPVPPALGEGLPSGWGAGFGNSPVPDYERETFYGGYALLVGQKKLSMKETERIAAYRGTRQQLLK